MTAEQLPPDTGAPAHGEDAKEPLSDGEHTTINLGRLAFKPSMMPRQNTLEQQPPQETKSDWPEIEITADHIQHLHACVTEFIDTSKPGDQIHIHRFLSYIFGEHRVGKKTYVAISQRIRDTYSKLAYKHNGVYELKDNEPANASSALGDPNKQKEKTTQKMRAAGIYPQNPLATLPGYPKTNRRR